MVSGGRFKWGIELAHLLVNSREVFCGAMLAEHAMQAVLFPYISPKLWLIEKVTMWAISSVCFRVKDQLICGRVEASGSVC